MSAGYSPKNLCTELKCPSKIKERKRQSGLSSVARMSAKHHSCAL